MLISSITGQERQPHQGLSIQSISEEIFFANMMKKPGTGNIFKIVLAINLGIIKPKERYLLFVLRIFEKYLFECGNGLIVEIIVEITQL